MELEGNLGGKGQGRRACSGTRFIYQWICKYFDVFRTRAPVLELTCLFSATSYSKSDCWLFPSIAFPLGIEALICRWALGCSEQHPCLPAPLEGGYDRMTILAICALWLCALGPWRPGRNSRAMRQKQQEHLAVSQSKAEIPVYKREIHFSGVWVTIILKLCDRQLKFCHNSCTGET